VLRVRGVDQRGVAGEVAALGRGDDDALRALGIDLSAVRARAEAAFGPGALDRPRRRRAGVLRWMSGTSGHLRFSAAAKRALEQSLRQALDLRSGAIGVDHLLLGLLADDQAPAATTLRRLGADPADVRAAVRTALQRAA
jgi:hypothetical protein